MAASRALEITFVGDTRQLDRAIGRAQSRLDRFQSGARRVGGAFTRNLTLPIVGAGIAAGKMSVDFEKSMTDIRALVGASNRQMEGYRRGVLRLARETPQGPKALADALYFVTSSGFEGASALKVLEASAKAAAAGLGDTTAVADAVTSAVNAYGQANLKASEATDILLATVREGKAEPTELAGAIGRVIAPAQAMGVEFREVGGAVAGLSLTGLDAAEAVTALRGILSGMLKPTKQTAEFMKDAGISVADVREQIREKGLLATLQMLRDRFGDNEAALGKLFPNVRALNGFLALTGTNAEKNARVMNGVAKSVGDTNRAFGKASEDASFRFRRAWSQMQARAIIAGGALIPLATSVVDAMGNLATEFGGLSPQGQKAILIVAGVAAAIGPLVTLAANAITAVKALGVALKFLGTTQIGFAITALGLLAGAYVISRFRTDEFATATDRAKASLDRLRTTADSAREADLNLATARAGARQANLAVADAERALAKAREDGKPRDVERAEAALQSARAANRYAAFNVTRAENAATKARDDNKKATFEAANATGDLTDELNRLVPVTGRTGGSVRGVATATGALEARQKAARDRAREFAERMADLARKADNTADRLRRNHHPALARQAERTAEAARKARDLARDLDRIPTRTEVFLALNVQPSDWAVAVSGPGGSQTITGRLARGGVRAGGGRIRVGSRTRDSVHAILARDEFVVTAGGEKMIERDTGIPGYLDLLERRQPPHFQTGGRVLANAAGIRPASARLTRGSEQVAYDIQTRAAFERAARAFAEMFQFGGAGTGGLVPQVLRALGWARSHGWGGSITSGFRSSAQQAALYAAYLRGEGNLAAPPGSSSHEQGAAVDVSDYYGFAAAMASAPPGSRLFARVPGEPWHYSVSGYRNGGRVRISPIQPGWPRPRRRRNEKWQHYQRRLAQRDVSSLPVRIQYAQARAALTRGKKDDTAAARRELRWWRRGRGAGWLTQRQKTTVLQNLLSARDALADLLGIADDEPGARDVSARAALEAIGGLFGDYGSNIGTSSAMLMQTGIGAGGTATTKAVGAGGVTSGAPRKSVTVNLYFTKPPDDPHPLMRSAEFAAEAALGAL